MFLSLLLLFALAFVARSSATFPAVPRSDLEIEGEEGGATTQPASTCHEAVNKITCLSGYCCNCKFLGGCARCCSIF
ncbi:unnamed protein product [Linum trigynum]|uniref:Uncharacterized protein n=1 Tax=Linum trigynum TaxID=586398 RepID=A0AAV2EBS9_9ROSI